MESGLSNTTRDVSTGIEGLFFDGHTARFCLKESPELLRMYFSINSRFGKKSKGKRFAGIKKLCTFAMHYRIVHLGG